MTILDELAAVASERVDHDIRFRSRASMRDEAEALARDVAKNSERPFHAALARPGLSFICEVKKASPSKGLIAENFPYRSIARAYEEAGADAISVLTEPSRFLGADRYLQEIAADVLIPVLRKDFIIDDYQIYQAKVLGASAILLICSLLSNPMLRDFRLLAEELGLSALVETHDADEITRALASGASIIGVNNRNLKDFSVSFDNAANLRALVPQEALFVAESGVKNADDVAQVAAMGADAVLIGEALMRSDDITATLSAFRASAQATESPQAKSQSPAVKCCGLCQAADVAIFNDLLPDYAGLVFYPPSSRAVSVEEARALRAALDPRVQTVGVFVDADPEVIAALYKDDIISIAQLHGAEDEAAIERLRQLAVGIEIWKAFIVKDANAIEAANRSSADLVLLDANLGGGKPFDWSLLESIKRPYGLAGGLSPENLPEALEHYNPIIVDVSSGIEASERAADGRTHKDPERMARFIAYAKNEERML